jgi:hypothetical protein
LLKDASGKRIAVRTATPSGEGEKMETRFVRTSRYQRIGAAAVFLFAVLCLPFPPARVLAGTISLETKTETEVTGHRLRVTVLKTNRGTESAFQVRTRIAVLGRELKAPVRDQLNPGASYTDAFDLDLDPVLKGRYPVIVSTDFHDAKRYPFTALSATTFRMGEEARADIIVWAGDVDLGNAGHVRIGLKNLASSPVRIRASLYAPREVTVSRPEKSLSLAARSEGELDFFVSNFSALESARYAVYCVVEYESKGIHHTEIARLQLSIGANENFFRRYRPIWAGLAGALCVVLIAALLWGRRKNV